MKSVDDNAIILFNVVLVINLEVEKEFEITRMAFAFPRSYVLSNVGRSLSFRYMKS